MTPFTFVITASAALRAPSVCLSAIAACCMASRVASDVCSRFVVKPVTFPSTLVAQFAHADERFIDFRHGLVERPERGF